MKQLISFVVIIATFTSCMVMSGPSDTPAKVIDYDLSVTQSLFNDKNATISEENIQKILDGNYKLPEKLRIAIVKLESKQSQRNYYYYYRTDEEYLKAQQSYLNLFSKKFEESQRITSVSVIPDLLISNNPVFVNIREAAVRTQSDLVAIYSITSEIYTKDKLFSGPDIKAYSTIQFIIMDVRTGLLPFSTIVTQDYQSRKQKEDFDDADAVKRVKNEAILLSINKVGEQLAEFLKIK